MKDDRPSTTALLILMSVLTASRNKVLKELLDPEIVEWSELLAAKVFWPSRFYLQLIKNPLGYKPVVFFERLLAPGFVEHVALRKAQILDATQKSVNEGVKQILVIGAGYDFVALKMAKLNKDLICIEIDHPATQKAKTQGLVELSLPSNLHLVAADLAQKSLLTVLQETKQFNRSLKTLVIIEGVLMYLPGKVVSDFFDSLHQLNDADLSCVFTFLNLADGHKPIFNSSHNLIYYWLKFIHEDLKWSMEEANLHVFLHAKKFSLTRIFDFNQLLLSKKMSTKLNPAQGEMVAQTWIRKGS